VDVTAWPATAVLDAFRRRALSPVEYLEALAVRIETLQPTVNALGDLYLDEAFDAARRAAARYAGRGSARALEGLPVVVKDETEVAGKRTTNGSLL